jgi:hypothetical protein
MRKAVPFLLLIAAACGPGDNVVVGGVAPTPTTPLIVFDNINSVISGRVGLTDANGTATGTAQVVILSDRPNLCAVLAVHPDYFRAPVEPYEALILFFPATNHLGTFEIGRPGDEGTNSEILGVADISKPPVSLNALRGYGYLSLRDWAETEGGETDGSFNLLYSFAASVNVQGSFPFYGKFKATPCTTLDGTKLP